MSFPNEMLNKTQPAPVATNCDSDGTDCAAPRPSSCCDRPSGRSDTAPNPTVRSRPTSNHKADTTSNVHSDTAPSRCSCQHCRVWSPDPAKVVGVSPVAIGIEIFRAPNVLVVILDVVTQPLREIALAIVDPIVNRVECGGGVQFPVAGVIA